MFTSAQSEAISSGVDMCKEVLIDGLYTYIGIAPRGSSTASPVWKVQRIYQPDISHIHITWSDAGEVFDNASSLTSYK